MSDARHCHSCRRTLVAHPRIPSETEEHCPSPNCHWCMPCDRAKRAEGEA